MAVARFIYHTSFQVQEGKVSQLLDWLKENETRLAATHPAGTQWLGLYGDVIAGESPGLWHVFVGADSYGALDGMSSAAGHRESEFGRLVDEMLALTDLSNDAKGGTWLYRGAPNIVTWEAPPSDAG